MKIIENKNENLLHKGQNETGTNIKFNLIKTKSNV